MQIFRLRYALAPLLVLGFLAGDGGDPDEVSGRVVDARGSPVPGATVRVKATSFATRTDSSGLFRLTDLPEGEGYRITAWAPGHYIAGTEARTGDDNITLALKPYSLKDETNYEWIKPAASRPPTGDALVTKLLDAAYALSYREVFVPLTDQLDLGCQDCHGETIVNQWRGGAHALGASNPRFLSLYNGTDLDGHRSEETRYVTRPDYGRYPVRNDPAYGAGYALDFATAGNCATCHVPSAAIDAPYQTDPNEAGSAELQGTHCDFCHKVVDVVLDPRTGRPFENAPGVLSMRFARPSHEQVFFGPYDDVDVGPDTFLPLIRESTFCAPCHDASFWGTPIYTSFPEWQASRYADEGVTCQDCHMRPDGVTSNFAPERGGVDRDPATIPTHFFPGSGDAPLLGSAVDLRAVARRHAGQVFVDVRVTNDSTGHHIPSGSPLRQMLLVVRAEDPAGHELELVSGPVLPEWCGTGNPAEGYVAGLPGKAYAKILAEKWTAKTPTAAYWNPTRVVSDTRLAADESDSTSYAFFDHAAEEAHVSVELWYRRAYIELMDQKGWDTPDILLGSVTLKVSAEESQTRF